MNEAGDFIRRIKPFGCGVHSDRQGRPHLIDCRSYHLSNSSAVLVGAGHVMLEVWQRQSRQNETEFLRELRQDRVV